MSSEPKLFYALESLPALLGKGDLFMLMNALANAMGEDAGRYRQKGETDGEYIARMTRMLACVKMGKSG